MSVLPGTGDRNNVRLAVAHCWTEIHEGNGTVDSQRELFGDNSTALGIQSLNVIDTASNSATFRRAA